jgi:hypothetical protein
MPTVLRDEDQVARAQSPSSRTLRFEHRQFCFAGEDVEQFDRLVQFPRRSPREACNPARAAVKLECADRAWRFFVRIGKINAYYLLYGLRAQIVDHHVWFLLCRRWYLLIEKTTVAGKKLRSCVPKTLRVHESSFAVRPGENDHQPVGITNLYLLVLGLTCVSLPVATRRPRGHCRNFEILGN